MPAAIFGFVIKTDVDRGLAGSEYVELGEWVYVGDGWPAGICRGRTRRPSDAPPSPPFASRGNRTTTLSTNRS